MSKKNKHNTRKIFQKVGLDKPSDDFTRLVMSKVNSIVELDELNDTSLTILLKKNVLESPGAHFTSRILARVRKPESFAYKPLISKKSWSLLLLFFISLVGYALFLEPAETMNKTVIANYLSKILDLISNLSNHFTVGTHTASILLISVLSLISLLLIDSYIRVKRSI